MATKVKNVVGIEINKSSHISAEKLKKDPVVNPQSGNKNTTEGQSDGNKSDENSGGQSVPTTGTTS